MNKKGNAMFVFLGILAVIALGIGGVWYAVSQNDGEGLTIGGSGSSDEVSLKCEGVSSVSLTYNDIDTYNRGTDPASDNLYIVTDEKGSQSEGAITLNPATEYEYLAAENSTTVFSVPGKAMTECVNTDLVEYVVKAGAPTITLTNDDGVTANSDTNHESVDADQVYTFEMQLKAPGDQCSMAYGALLVADFDKTYIDDVDVNGLSKVASPNYLAHVNGDNSTADGFRAFDIPGELCDGVKKEFTGSFETAGATPNEGNANIVWHFLPKNYDINQETGLVIGPAVEDEDNNAITLGNTTAELHTA